MNYLSSDQVKKYIVLNSSLVDLLNFQKTQLVRRTQLPFLLCWESVREMVAIENQNRVFLITQDVEIAINSSAKHVVPADIVLW